MARLDDAHGADPAQPLTLERIVTEARALLETGGYSALTMRALAARLNSRPMSLYHYVRNKSELLTLALSDAAAEIDWAIPSGTPIERMVAVGVEVHENLSRLPWVVPILSRGTNIGLSALASTEHFFAAAADAGLDDAAMLALWRGVWYLISADLQMQAAAAERSSDERAWYETTDSECVQGLTQVSRLLPHWRELSAGYSLQTSIRALVTGTVLQHSAAGAPASSAAAQE
ncbi:helix-turn-helix transcriptional regulator [Pseudoclavibacter sp. CFCC 14310]|uniref:TetR/AcrR family transcriptional regulator n=1 Tax=Pseudoclavibacter sp. CFCC 14310 TaxID=2615180 RepID=UPI0013017DE9|nr:helix-turn-helix domain-containing protein [Pseudoclavibacter sp. CFCC 14310]KAB1647350.1 helix-turn-helix transcriptional regulator [Pseudoclavibacter sp. CFCC 14310]